MKQNETKWNKMKQNETSHDRAQPAGNESEFEYLEIGERAHFLNRQNSASKCRNLVNKYTKLQLWISSTKFIVSISFDCRQIWASPSFNRDDPVWSTPRFLPISFQLANWCRIQPPHNTKSNYRLAKLLTGKSSPTRPSSCWFTPSLPPSLPASLHPIVDLIIIWTGSLDSGLSAPNWEGQLDLWTW